MTFSATLDRTVQLYRASFGRLVTIAVVGGLPQIPFALALDPGKEKPPQLHFTSRAAVLGVLAALFVTLTTGALTRAALAVHEGAPIDVGSAFRASLARLPALLLAGILALVASVAAMIPLVFPGIYVFLGFSFSYLAVLGEGLGPWAGLKRSWRLARGLRDRIFGLLFVWGILQMVLSFAVGGALSLFGLGDLVGRLGKQLATILITPCYALSLCLTYFAARAEREGHDLALEAQRLAGGPPGPGARPL